MRYENLLASRYIKAQKRQSAFTVISIAAAVAIMTMVFLMYTVIMNFSKLNAYSQAPYHLAFPNLTEEQGEALQNEEQVRSVKLERAENGTVTAYILFGGSIGDRELWLQNAADNIGAKKALELREHQWNDKLMEQDNINDDAKLKKLRLFSIFFVFALIWAFALRMIIDTAFEVSSKERERHYGVLQSVGATPEQIVKVITAEGLKLCVIGIPLGLAAGIVFAYIMYRAVLASGITNMFDGMSNAKQFFPFIIDPKMLIVAALFGMAWVFFSAYGVGMRIIRKTPIEAITTRADEVKKVKKHTLSGLLFGVSGSIASRNARRQKKRFFITVLTLTVSITLFALFSSLTETIEKSISTAANIELNGADFYAELVDDPSKGITYEDGIRDIEESGLFRDIGVYATESIRLSDTRHSCIVQYVNKEEFRRIFSKDSPISYEELVRTGGYILNSKSYLYDEYSNNKIGDKVTVISHRRTIPRDKLEPYIDRDDIFNIADKEDIEHEISIIGALEPVNDNLLTAIEFIAAIDTYQSVKDEWFGDIPMTSSTFSHVKENDYNTQDYKKVIDWINGHTDTVSIEIDNYGKKWKVSNIMSCVRTGVLILNVFIALTALINLLNIVSTGIANRRGEMASLQCVGMTDRQLYRMTMIECLQFAGAAAIISAVICAVIIFGSRLVFSILIDNTFVTESEERIKMFKDMVKIDHVKPFVRIVLAALTAFAAGAVTSFVMVRIQNKDSLSDQIRGSEMKPDTKKTHLLRNVLIAAAGASILVIAGLRIYSIAAYRHDRNEYAKAGYLNLVDGTDTKINVYSTGVQNGKHTIVGLSGMGIQDYPITTKALNERLGKENTVVYADRPGYGFSDDSYKKQTLEEVVENFRAGLKNAGFEAPYVLMPHSYASFYALWWQTKYPEEVEAIVFMDCITVPKNEHWRSWTVDDYPSEDAAYADARRTWVRTWLGLDRLTDILESAEDQADGKSVLTQEQIALCELTAHRSYSAAMLSQDANAPEAARELLEIWKPTDTPKLWFDTEPSCEEDIREQMEFEKADFEAAGLTYKQNPEAVAKVWWENEKWYCQDYYDNTLTPFLEQCGNCRLVPIGGYHHLFWAQKPDEVADTILAFLAETTE